MRIERRVGRDTRWVHLDATVQLRVSCLLARAALGDTGWFRPSSLFEHPFGRRVAPEYSLPEETLASPVHIRAVIPSSVPQFSNPERSCCQAPGLLSLAAASIRNLYPILATLGPVLLLLLTYTFRPPYGFSNSQSRLPAVTPFAAHLDAQHHRTPDFRGPPSNHFKWVAITFLHVLDRPFLLAPSSFPRSAQSVL